MEKKRINWTKIWKVALVVIGVFAAGLIAGVLGEQKNDHYGDGVMCNFIDHKIKSL